GLLQVIALVLFTMLIIEAIKKPKESIKLVLRVVTMLVVIWGAFFLCLKVFGDEYGVFIGAIAMYSLWTLTEKR
ncbi:hypothetical protein, partial [Serratia rhizosphaerae]